jgi:leucyl aminopeptidase (aminopeptidase T)
MTGADPTVSDARLAQLVLTRSLRLRRGQSVIIEAWPHALELAEEFVVQARRLGIRPMVLYEGERAFFDSQRLASVADGSAIATPELAAVAATDAYVFLPGPADPKRWSDLPAPRRAAYNRWMETWNRALHGRGARACYAYFAADTEAAAREYEVDLASWHREIREGSAIDPASFRRSARRIVGRLRAGRRVSITHPNGTNIDLGLAGRLPYVDDGSVDDEDLRLGQNWTVLPAGLVIVALNERFAEGRFIANRPSRHRRGVNRGVRWTFHNGRLISYESDDRTGAFAEAYRSGGPGRDRPALLSVGLNPRIHTAPLQEDQGRGIVSFYIGSNDHYGGRTRGSFHDYALLEGADVTVDGHPIVRAGEPL